MPASSRYWLVLPNGYRQLIDPRRFDLEVVAQSARRLGGRLVAERTATAKFKRSNSRVEGPPISALGPLFRARLGRFHRARVEFFLDVNPRATVHVLGGYYRKRRLVRVYAVDRETGRRPLDELFDTFLHEVAHHLEYTEPDTFRAEACQRARGVMHSPLFWRIFGELRSRWAALGGINPPPPRGLEES